MLLSEVIHFSTLAGLPKSIRVSRHRSPTSPFAGFSSTSMCSMPLMISAAFSMLVIAAQIAALEPLMVTCASTSMVFLLAVCRREWLLRSVNLCYTRTYE